MSRRSQILAEMGLSPVWVLRQEKTPSVSAKAETEGSREERIAKMGWDELKATVKGCTACPLRAGCTQTVFGVGDEQADWMLVGEAPGAEEDRLGEPFVGQAGRLLDNMLAAIDLGRDRNVYIANVLKCRPPGNRNPEPDEVERCEPFLFRQIDIVKPKVIVALGKFAAQSLLRTTEPITRLRGREYKFRSAILMPTFHPAYLLRNPSSKREVWEDMKRVRDLLAQGADE